MDWKPGTARLRLSLSIFSVFFISSFLVWIYLNSDGIIARNTALNAGLIGGILFSIATGFFTWSLESRRDYLEREVRQRAAEAHQKNLETKNAELTSSAIYQACRILFINAQIEEIYKHIIDLIMKSLHADECSIMLLDESNQLYVAASRGLRQEVILNTHLKLGERVAGKSALYNREYLIVDGVDKYHEFKDLDSCKHIKSSIVCPMVAHQKVIGVLNLNRTIIGDNFTVADLMHVSIFASQIALALENVVLNRKLDEKDRQITILQGLVGKLSQGVQFRKA